MAKDERGPSSETMLFRPIGRIRTPFSGVEGTPIQPAGARSVEGTVEVFDEFAAGLKDLAGFSHVLLFYWFHRSGDWSPEVTPFLDDEPRGVFATRAPALRAGPSLCFSPEQPTPVLARTPKVAASPDDLDQTPDFDPADPEPTPDDTFDPTEAEPIPEDHFDQCGGAAGA